MVVEERIIYREECTQEDTEGSQWQHGSGAQHCASPTGNILEGVKEEVHHQELGGCWGLDLPFLLCCIYKCIKPGLHSPGTQGHVYRRDLWL